jgi:NTP pyrophosphatase (non-canonical NTP hydrolase)
MQVSDLVNEAYGNALQKGWHEEQRSFGDLIALCHSELSEALEEYRKGKGYNEIYLGGSGKPEGIPVELADVMIRIFDICGHLGIDIEQAIAVKMKFNSSRPHRHGGKII